MCSILIRLRFRISFRGIKCPSLRGIFERPSRCKIGKRYGLASRYAAIVNYVPVVESGCCDFLAAEDATWMQGKSVRT